MSRNTVSKNIRQLEKKQFITTEPTAVYTSQGEKRNGNMLYTIQPIEKAKQYFYNKQLKNIDQMIADKKHLERVKKLNLQSSKEVG